MAGKKLIFILHSTPKMITYSMSNTPRRFEYQQKNSAMTNVELRGNLSKRAAGPEYQEFNQFRKMNLHETPNTKRTMVPELAVKIFNHLI